MTQHDRQAAPWAPDDDPGQVPRPGPREWGVLALGAIRRRWFVCAAVFLSVLAATAVARARKPLAYRVEAKILAQRSQALPSVVRTIPDDAPGRSAWEMIHQHDNLVALVRQANLLANPPPAGRRSPDSDPTEALVEQLDRELLVLNDEGTITVQLDWHDPQQAYLVVQSALQNFLEARHVQEITPIDEMISVFQGRASVLRKELADASEQARTRVARAPRIVIPRVPQPSEETVRVQSLLEGKQRALQDVEEFRRRRLADLQAQLDQARNTLSDAHPSVINLNKDIEALSRDTPLAQALRDDVGRLRKDYRERLAREGVSAGVTVPQPVIDPGAPPEEDQRVRDVRQQYELMSQRLAQAQAELDAARAAFKYRYNVIWPPKVPREPLPYGRKILLAGIAAALALAVLAAVAPDLLRGVIVERWQVERSLGIPVLGDLRRRP